MAEVYASDTISGHPDKIWETIRNFGALDTWHPAVATCEIENGQSATEVGCVRRMQTHDGGVIRERLLSLSDPARELSYCILESPLPLKDYVAKVAIRNVTRKKATFIEWSCTFTCDPAVEGELTDLLTNALYGAAFDALTQKHK